jgi:hypothetical protein
MKKLSDSFENKWKSLFQDAEATPSTSVWDRIDSRLAGSELARYKKKLFYYKITAAASIILALLFGSYSLYNVIQDSKTLQVTQDLQTGAESENSDDIQSKLPDRNDRVEYDDQSGISPADQPVLASDDESSEISNPQSGGITTDRTPSATNNQRDALSEKESFIAQDNQQAKTSGEQYMDPQKGQTGINSTQTLILASYETSDEEAGNLSSGEKVAGRGESDGNIADDNQMIVAYSPDAVFNIPYEKPGRKYYLHKKENPYDQPYILPLEEEIVEEDPKRLWAGLVLSSGVFNPNISYGESVDVAADASPSFGSVERLNMAGADFDGQPNTIISYKPEESSYNSEASFSYGIDFGYKFSKKFVVFSGLGYQHNYGSTTVHTYIEPTETHAKYANHAIVIERASPESGLDTYNELNAGVELNSVFEFVTIPVNLGYYLIDRKFKWMMTAGVATDVFIKNSINDSQGLFNEVEFKNGDDSPYNPIYFNGKFGTMINYTFLKNYQLSLEPSYRIGLSELTKDNANFSSRPSAFLISAGIAYVFR